MSEGNTKTAREVFTIEASAMREKAELTKEEKREERRRRKRQIKSHLHHKSIKHKEGNRAKGIAQGGDRFMAKQLVERMAKKKKRMTR